MIKDFFYNSGDLDIYVTKQLPHIAANWELTWDRKNEKYLEEKNSFAAMLNSLIVDLEKIQIPESYHEKEDIVAQYVITFLKWSIVKNGNRWIGDDYDSILGQGGFHDINQENLMFGAVGRISAALQFGQFKFDDVEEGHKKVLGDILTIILYHRWNGEEL